MGPLDVLATILAATAGPVVALGIPIMGLRNDATTPITLAQQ
jgi:hypothetical protein